MAAEPTVQYGLGLNIQGLRSTKLNILREQCATEDIFTICLCETWLDSSICDEEVGIPGYQLYRCDRKSRSRGGTAIYLKDYLVVNKNDFLNFSNDYCEVCAVYIQKQNIALISVYRPPGTSTHNFSEALSTIEEWIQEHLTSSTETLIFGDFNFSHLKWSRTESSDILEEVVIPSRQLNVSASSALQEQANRLLDFADNNYLMQTVSECTRGKNFLDLVFTNGDCFGSPNVFDNVISDHKSVIWPVFLNMPIINSDDNFNDTDLNLSHYNLFSTNTDWDKICDSLSTSLSTNTENLSVEEKLQLFYDSCLKCIY